MKSQAPDPTAVAALLRERWSIPPAVRLTVEDSQREGRPRLIVRVDRPTKARGGGERIELDVTHLRGGDPSRAWDLLADAVDALVGTLVESDYAHRDLPTGSDVEHEGSVLWVDVTASRPDLEAQAEDWLRKN